MLKSMLIIVLHLNGIWTMIIDMREYIMSISIVIFI